MRIACCSATAFAAALLLSGCGKEGSDSTKSSAGTPDEPQSAPAPTISAYESGETVQKIEHCVLETAKGRFEGPCERIEWGGPSFAIRRADGKAFVDRITEVVVEVDRPGEKAGGSYRRGAEGDLVPSGPLTFRDDCACWVGANFRIRAFADPK